MHGPTPTYNGSEIRFILTISKKIIYEMFLTLQKAERKEKRNKEVKKKIKDLVISEFDAGI